VAPGIQVPDEFAIGGIKERHTVTVPVSRSIGCSEGMPLCLFQDVLRVDRDLLRLDDGK
jgi:hypothetical protein